MKQPDSIDIAKKEHAMQTIAAMDEFQSITGENTGWDSEEDMTDFCKRPLNTRNIRIFANKKEIIY